MYDLIVIGAGAAGLNIASFINKAGFKVLLAEKDEKNIGGDCLNYGCIPSKSLIHVARQVHDARLAASFGFKTSGRINLAKVMQYVKERINIIRVHENADYFRSQGMDVRIGTASFCGRDAIEINKEKYRAKNIVIATGSRPRQLKIPGSEKAELLNNETVFDLQQLPKNLLVIGGGPIGAELGQAFSYLGSKVTILQKGPMFLPKEDRDIANMLLDAFKKQRIEVFMDAEPKEFLSKNELLYSYPGGAKKLRFDAALVSIGRDLDFSELQLDRAGIRTKDGRIALNDYLQTTNKNVYVSGDAAGSYQFTHATELHAGVIIKNFFSPFRSKVNYEKLGWVTYTDPEIATFGVHKNELQKRGIEHRTLTTDFSMDDRAITDDYVGLLKLHISKDRILGGTMISRNAGELVQELILAMEAEIDIKHIFNKVYPYPTASRINKRTIAEIFKNKLNSRTKRLLRWLY